MLVGPVSDCADHSGTRRSKHADPWNHTSLNFHLAHLTEALIIRMAVTRVRQRPTLQAKVC